MALLTISASGTYDLNQAPFLGGAFSGELANRVVLFPIYGFSNSDTVTIMTHAGDDVVDATVYSPAASIYLGAGNDTLYMQAGENAPAKTYYDQAGKDTVFLDGFGIVYAGQGNDHIIAGNYYPQTINFSILTDLQGNTTSVTQGVTFDMARTTIQNLGVFGKDVITGFEIAIGTAGNDKIAGTNANNHIEGGAGNDLLNGRDGNDMLRGGDGADTLIGGVGADSFELMSTDSARDTVRYLSIKDSGAQFASGSHDYIDGFIVGQDKIDLSAIDANATQKGNQAFVFRATGDFRSKGGEVLIEQVGGNFLILVDTDADMAPEMVIRVAGIMNLTASDFIL